MGGVTVNNSEVYFGILGAIVAVGKRVLYSVDGREQSLLDGGRGGDREGK